MKKIHLRNFRCYEDKEIEFRSGINLLIGDNSVGKTSLLRACNFVVNSFFCGYSDENTSWKSVDDSDFRNVGINEQPIEIEFSLGDWDLLPIATSQGAPIAIKEDDVLLIQKNSKKNARNLVIGLKPLKNYGATLLRTSHSIVSGQISQQHALPVYAYFTTEDIHSVRKFDKEGFRKRRQKPSFGYFESHDCRGLFDCWLKRLLVLREAKDGELEIANVRNAIVSALGPGGCNIIDDVEIRPMEGEVYFHFVDGRESAAPYLSDGYRRLVNVVMDIAIRCALLNQHLFGAEAYRQTHGTVIIDEIDEHLHPALQVCVLKALHDTFPNVQFIVSTHAPLVMSSVENTAENVVYKLEYRAGVYTHRILNTYGVDVNSILEEGMEALVRPEQIGAPIKEVRQLLADHKVKEAKEIIARIESQTDPRQADLVKLRAIVTRLELLGK